MKITNALRSLARVALLTAVLPVASQAQYTRTDLTSNQSGGPPNINPELINAWGLVQLGTSPIWLSDNQRSGHPEEFHALRHSGN